MKKMISRRNFLKVCAVAGSAVALSACGGSKKPAAPDPSNTDQTSFDIVGGQSALSPGYNDNEVLKKLADNVGIKMNYETMSDSLSEQVNMQVTSCRTPLWV
jgi:putative aldouronate transport system substrate-binding protein